MKRIVIFCALCALFGCRQANTPQTEPIALYYSTVEQSKTDLLTQGDEIGVFAAVEGTERYFLDNTKYIVGADGRSLSTAPAVYYPEAKQAVTFMAYLPFGGTWDGGVGTFSVPSDQTTALALKEADLCWAKASSTPVAAPVALEFTHKMARLLITTNEPTEKITIPNVFSGGILDIKTGAFTNTLRSEVFTTGNELIVPAQPLTRLLLTVAGVEHPFTPAVPLDLPAGQTTTLNLTLNPITKTATLSGSSTTNWTGSAIQGNPTQAVSNILTMHWPNYVPQGATPNKVVLTINNTDYTVSSGITHSGQSFTVPFASSVLRYPYTITKITFYQGATQVVPACVQLLGSSIYKSGLSTIGIKDQANAVLINGLWWATGNLIASNSTAGARGEGGCRIGLPSDGGLYFQFGSLIGWKGGALANGGTGAGKADKTSGSWVGSSWSWANDAMIWPTEMLLIPAAWSSQRAESVEANAFKKWYFDFSGISSKGSINYSDRWSDMRAYEHPTLGKFADGAMASLGIGDPCSYYLGAPWRTPTADEHNALCNNKATGFNQTFSWESVNGSLSWTPTPGGYLSGKQVFIPLSGRRNYYGGTFDAEGAVVVGVDGTYWSSSVYEGNGGGNLNLHSGGVRPKTSCYRAFAFPARCVAQE